MLTADYLTKLCKSFCDFKYSLMKVIDGLCKAEGLTNMQTMTLFMLKSEGSISVGALSSLLNMTQSNVSALCKKLEKDGLIERTRSKTDERTVNLSLSQKGEDTLMRMLDRGSLIGEKCSEIPQERLDMLVETMDEATHMLVSVMKK